MERPRVIPTIARSAVHGTVMAQTLCPVHTALTTAARSVVHFHPGATSGLVALAILSAEWLGAVQRICFLGGSHARGVAPSLVLPPSTPRRAGGRRAGRAAGPVAAVGACIQLAGCLPANNLLPNSPNKKANRSRSRSLAVAQPMQLHSVLPCYLAAFLFNVRAPPSYWGALLIFSTTNNKAVACGSLDIRYGSHAGDTKHHLVVL